VSVGRRVAEHHRVCYIWQNRVSFAIELIQVCKSKLIIKQLERKDTLKKSNFLVDCVKE